MESTPKDPYGQKGDQNSPMGVGGWLEEQVREGIHATQSTWIRADREEQDNKHQEARNRCHLVPVLSQVPYDTCVCICI